MVVQAVQLCCFLWGGILKLLATAEARVMKMKPEDTIEDLVATQAVARR